MNVRFFCPVCECPGRLDVPGSAWQCMRCDHVLRARIDTANSPLGSCAVCGSAELYRRKDFPHWLGLTLLTVACAAFLVTNYLYQQWLAWAILLGSAVLDGLLYLMVGDVVVCYRCGAHHRRCASDREHPPFDLAIAERYRQEKLRRELLKEQK